MNIIIAIVMLNLLIGVHELGHFLAAKSCKVGVDEFSLGMGPKIISKEINGTVYSLRWIILGGYVKLNEEDFKESIWWKHIIIMLAGVVFNLLFAIIGAWVYLLFSDIVDVGIFKSLYLAIIVVVRALQQMIIAVAEMFKAADTSGFAGPVGVVDVVSTYVSSGWMNTIEIFTMLNINLFIMNLLPLPILDGGQIVLVLIKKAFNKKEMPRFETAWTVIGLALLGLILFFALKNDILRFFG